MASKSSKAKRLLDSLVTSSRKVKETHKWQDLADMIAESDGIFSITSHDVAVLLPDGYRQQKEIEGGWTEKHYEYLAPVLSGLWEPEWNKAMVAKEVLMTILRQLGCREPETAWWLLCKSHGLHEEEWLAQYVKTKGFLTIAAEMTKALKEYRISTPQLHINKKAKPSWDDDLRRLCVGEIVIKQFKEPAENQVAVLDKFQYYRWRRRIPNPLTTPGQPLKRIQQRRRDTIAGLNEDHVTPGIIRFGGDGRTTDIIWEWCGE